jgi:chromosome segregation ATPase
MKTIFRSRFLTLPSPLLLASMTTALLLFPATAPAQEDAAGAAQQAAQAKANEQRLRDTLRTTTQQLRAAETEKASLQAGQTERDEKIAALEARLKALTEQSNADREAAEKTIGQLKHEGEKSAAETARLAVSLDKWKAAYTQAANVAKSTESARAKLESSNILLERKAEERTRQNLELYTTAREILQRYSDFGLGRAIAAREPFTGIAKARLEEQVQDYADKLDDQKIKPEPSDGKPSTAPVPASQPAPNNPTTSRK